MELHNIRNVQKNAKKKIAHILMLGNSSIFLVLDYEEDVIQISFNSGSIGSGSNVNFGERKNIG